MNEKPEEKTPDTPIPESSVEVKQSVLKEGKVNFMNKAGWTNPSPAKFKIVVRTIQGSLASSLTLLAAFPEIISAMDLRVVTLVFGLIGIVSESFLRATGVQSASDEAAGKKE